MPDISMCRDHKCPKKQTCIRHQASGTRPSLYRQAWIIPVRVGDKCDDYMQKETK
jgi:hypothetical protein